MTSKIKSPAFTVAKFLDGRLKHCGKMQREVAREAGYLRPNIISNFKKGWTKIPVCKAPALADALGVPREQFLRLVLAEYHPEVLAVIEDVLGALITENERQIIEYIREVSGGADPDIDSETTRDLLRTAFGK